MAKINSKKQSGVFTESDSVEDSEMPFYQYEHLVDDEDVRIWVTPGQWSYFFYGSLQRKIAKLQQEGSLKASLDEFIEKIKSSLK